MSEEDRREPLSDEDNAETASWFGRMIEADRQREADRRAGIPRVGGLLGPDYISAYLQAARLLTRAPLEQRHDLAIPCAFLQRHAVELMLKYLLAAEYRLEADERTLEETKKARAYMPVAPRAVPRTHDLAKLANLTIVAFQDPFAPSELIALAREMGRFEDSDETRLRYGSGKPGHEYAAESFPVSVIVPIIEWQRRLDVIEARDWKLSPDDTTTLNLIESLWHEGNELTADIAHVLEVLGAPAK